MAQNHRAEAPISDEHPDRAPDYPPGSDRPAEWLRAILFGIALDWAMPLAPLRAVRIGIGGKAGGETPLPIPVPLADARRELSESLFGWCAVLVEDRTLTTAVVRQDDVPAMCALLATHADWWAEHEAWLDMAAEVEAHAHRLGALVRPDRPTLVRIGACPLEVGPDEVCGGVVLADPETGLATCRACRATERIEFWQGVIALPRHITIRELVRIAAYEGLAVSEGAVRAMVDRGEITVAERDARGRRLVIRDDALADLRAVLDRRTTHR